MYVRVATVWDCVHLDTKWFRVFMSLTSHSSRRQQDANRCTACRLCPPRSPPRRTASPQTHKALKQHMGKKSYLIYLWYICFSLYKIWIPTSGIEVTLKGGSRAATGPEQQKACCCDHPVNHSQLHLHLVGSAPDSSSPYVPLTYTSQGFKSVHWRCGHSVARSPGCGKWRHPSGMRRCCCSEGVGWNWMPHIFMGLAPQRCSRCASAGMKFRKW